MLAHVPAARDPLDEVHPWYGLVELAGPASADLDTPLADALSAAFEHDLLTDAVVAGSPAQRAGLWTLREGISEAQNPEGPSLKHDVTVPIGSLPSFVSATGRALEGVMPGVRLVTYGHVGDGNLHHNLSKPVGSSDDDFLALGRPRSRGRSTTRSRLPAAASAPSTASGSPSSTRWRGTPTRSSST